MAHTDPQIMAEQLAADLQAKLQIRRGETLAEKLPRARTLLPRPVHRAAAEVAAAAARSAHPKLRKQVDLPAVQAAFQKTQTYLKGIDPKKRRGDMLLSMAASVSVNLLLLAGVLAALIYLMPV